MKRIIFIATFFLTFSSFMYLDAQWARTYGGSDYEYIWSIQQTSDGGYIVAGNTESFGAGDIDIWILKFSSTGAIEWQRTYGGIDEDYAWSIQQTSDGGYIVAADTYSFGAGYYDIWILKLSSTGAIEWQRTYGGIEYDWYPSIQQTSDGGYVIVSTTDSFGAGYFDIWILKLSSTGAIEWQRTYGGIDKDYAWSIQQTSDGGYIVAGETYSFGAGYFDIWILKLSSTGAIEWQRTYGGIEYEWYPFIQQTSDGGYVIASATDSFGAGYFDIWILKLSSTGAIEWQRTYGGVDGDSARSIQQTSDGGYVVAGTTDSFGAGDYDIWILKLSSTGAIEWQRTYGGVDGDSAHSIQQTSDGGYVVAGGTDSFGAGLTDIIVLKLYSDGDINPSCGFIGSSNASVINTYVSPGYTYITSGSTYVTPLAASVFPQDTYVAANLLCEAPRYTLIISATTGGTTDPAPGSHTYYSRTEVQIEAIPDTGYRFSGWTGDVPSGHENDNPITITMDSGKSITANFKAITTAGDGDTGKKGGCFIATAAYGSSLHPYVNILRDFRDRYLLPSRLGSKMVDLYYKYSPFLANFIAKHYALKVVVRISLLPFIAISYSILCFGPVITTAVLIFIFMLPVFFIWRYRR